MQSADLLAVASAAAPPAAPPSASAADADAFARALAGEVEAAGDDRAQARETTGAAGDGRCGTSADTNEDRPRDAVPQRVGGLARGDLSLRGALAGLLRGTGLDAVVQPSAEGKATATDGILGAGPKPTPLKAALDALAAAVQEALKNPSDSAVAQGQLPGPVQAALDQVLAAAPPGLQDRVAAFAGKLTERLAALLAGTSDGDAAPLEVSPQPPATEDGEAASAAAVSAGVLAALGEVDKDPALAVPMLLDRKAAATEPAAPPPAAPASSTAAPAASAAGADAGTAAANTPAAPASAEVAAPAPEPVAAMIEGAASPVSPAASAADAKAAAAAVVRGSPELVAHVAATIARKLDGRSTRFDMELFPSDMGRVDVRLNIDRDGRVAAQLAFDNPVAATDFRARADELRRHLQDAGFQVASEDLTFTDRESGGSGQHAGQGFADPEAARDAARGRAFREGERTARLAEDAGRLQRRTTLGVDVRI